MQIKKCLYSFIYLYVVSNMVLDTNITQSTFSTPYPDNRPEMTSKMAGINVLFSSVVLKILIFEPKLSIVCF